MGRANWFVIIKAAGNKVSDWGLEFGRTDFEGFVQQASLALCSSLWPVNFSF